MNDQQAAQELVKVAKLLAGETFKCPDCETKVLENTGYCLKCKKKVKKASNVGSFHRDGQRVYVDTAFLRNTAGILPGSELKHLGGGEFYLETPSGDVEFDRMRGKPFDGQSGRSHLLSDDQGGSLAKKLLRGMEGNGKAVKK